MMGDVGIPHDEAERLCVKAEAERYKACPLCATNKTRLEAAVRLAESWKEIRPEATSYKRRVESDAADYMDDLAATILKEDGDERLFRGVD